MKELHADMESHLEGDVTNLCNAWRLTRKDGVVFGFTDHDQQLIFDGTIFAPDSGFLPSSVRSELGLNVDDGEVVGAFSNDVITSQDLSDGRYDNAEVEIFTVNWQEPESFLKLRTQEIGEVSYSDNVFRAELRSIAHRLDQPKGRVFSRKCGADLGDQTCSVDLNSTIYMGSGSVISAANDTSCIADGLSDYQDGWFRYGLLTWQTGRNQNLKFELLDHVIEDGDVILKFFSPLAHVPSIGDTFIITAGCSKSFETCKEKFSNLLNFQGFPHLPGSNFAYGYADSETIHDGRPLVK